MDAPLKIISGLEQLEKIFYEAYGILTRRFEIFTIPMKEVNRDPRVEETRPGVYVYWTPKDGVVKIGRSFDNSRKRALSHVNTTEGMENIHRDPTAILYLFNPTDGKDFHLVAGLEVLFEIELEPKVRSKRLG